MQLQRSLIQCNKEVRELIPFLPRKTTPAVYSRRLTSDPVQRGGLPHILFLRRDWLLRYTTENLKKCVSLHLWTLFSQGTAYCTHKLTSGRNFQVFANQGAHQDIRQHHSSSTGESICHQHTLDQYHIVLRFIKVMTISVTVTVLAHIGPLPQVCTHNS